MQNGRRTTKFNEFEEFYKALEKYCNYHYQLTGIYNVLIDNGIDSIDKLKNTPISDIANFRGIGGKRLSIIRDIREVT